MKEKIKKNKFIIAGIFVSIIFFITLFVFSKSYALEGFGTINLSCDKTTGDWGENIECIMTGTVASTSQVSSLSSQIKLSDNLELVEFVTDSTIWRGDGEGGNIQLYTADNQSSTFNIGSFIVRIKEGTNNTHETIKLEQNYFYDENFEEQAIENTSHPISTPQFTSDEYDLTKDYIFTETKDIQTIISKINTEGCNAVVEKEATEVTTGTIDNYSKLLIVKDNNLIKEYTIVYVGSDSYDLTKNYILESINDINRITTNIEVMNAELTINDNKVVLSYNNTEIKSWDILNITSDMYWINIKDNYLLLDGEINNDILNNITKTDNITLAINEYNLEITYQDEVIKTLNIINILTNSYKIDLSNKYIYIGNRVVFERIPEDITSTGTLSIKDNKLIISKSTNSDEAIEIVSLDIVNILSDKYNISDTKKYIYTKTANELDTIEANIEVTNGNIALEDNKLKVMYNDVVIDEFAHYYISSNMNINDNIISLSKEMTYQEFVNNLTLNGLEIQLYNKDNNLVTSGTISGGYTMKVYLGDAFIDTYTISSEYLKITNLKIDEEEQIIYHVPLNATYNELIENIDTSGTITVYSEEGNKLATSDVVSSYSVIRITLSSKVYEYKISVLGDVIGTGDNVIADVGIIYQHYKGKRTLDKIGLLAGDITGDGEIELVDVGLMYSYLKGRITDLHAYLE